MVSKLPWGKIQMFWAFKKDIFQFFANFRVTKLKLLSGKVRQDTKNCSNQNLVIGSFLENGFKFTLSLKTNCLSVWKGHFSVFCKLLSDEVETVFWESETEPLNSNLVIGIFLETGFETTLRSKTNVLSIWKGKSSVFCNFWLAKLKPFCGELRQSVQNLAIGSFL